MACTSCKKTNSEKYNDILKKCIGENCEKPNKISKRILHYVARSLIFLFLVVLIVPIIIPITIYVLFVTTILSDSINLVPMLVYIGKKLFNTNKGDEDEDEDSEYEDDKEFDEFLDEDYEPINHHDITIIKS
jgi:hypothetical protein